MRKYINVWVKWMSKITWNNWLSSLGYVILSVYVYCCSYNKAILFYNCIFDMLVYLVIYEHLATICIGLSDPYLSNPGADPGFQVRGGGGALKNICAERRKARKCLGYFVWKITILRQKIIFLCAPPPWIRLWNLLLRRRKHF
jgi:hypothetical protein